MNSKRLSEIEAEILAVESAIDKTFSKLREHFNLSSSPKTSTPKAPTLQPQSIIPSSLNESTLVKELSKPKIEILSFEGDPIHYTQFIRQFNSRVANNCDTPDEKISYLLQYTRGEARKIVQGYTHLDAVVGYPAVLKELKRRYGEEEYVAQSYIKKATQWPNVKPGDISALDNFGIFLRECHYAVGSIASTTILEYPENIKKLSQKLPQPMQDRWRSHAYKKKEKGLKVTFETLVDFVQREARILTDPIYGKNSLPENPPRKRATVHNTASSTSTVPTYQPRHSPANQASSVTPVPESCCLCQENHTISKCTQFINKSTEERREFAKARRLCFNCLKRSHRAQECHNPGRCRQCAKKHHTLLHQLRESVPVGNAVLSTGTGDSDHKAFFQLLPVHVMSNGRTIETVALLDSASQMTIIKESLAFDLGLKGESCTLTVNTLNSSSHVKSKNVSFSVKSESAPPLNIRNAKTLPVNKFQCSEQRLNPEWFHCQHLGIPNVITPSEVGLLIGVDQPEAHIQYGIKRGSKDQPIAVQTYLGWSLIGTDSHLSQSSPLSVNLLSVSDQSLEQFWSTESFGVSYQYSNPVSTEDRKAEAMLDKSTKLVNGNYEVGMLWKSEESTLPNNLEMAKDRYRLLNKRFEKDRNFEEKYRGIMRDNISRGYARKLTPEEAGLCSQRTWYLPHHAVTNTQKGKLRLVYDAAATYKGVSLNKVLMTGPDLLNSLFGVIQRFRLYEIAMVADIEQMFMQVHVPSTDADSLRFLYSEDNNPDSFEVYQMTSHIFGAKDSPACANYALRRTAQDHAHLYSEDVVKTVHESFYMDDLLTSRDSIPEAICLAQDLRELLLRGGFVLHKWMSNRQEVLTAVDSTHNMPSFDLDRGTTISQKTLGIQWNLDADAITFHCKLKPVLTKRGMLSSMASIFDPCGYISPFVVQAKILMQKIWVKKLEWDDELPPDIMDQWKVWLSETQNLQKLQLPRHHPEFTSKSSDVQIHTFCDASESAFGAVSYLRYQDDNGKIQCSFLASKTRVAPLKSLSIPRLELQGAVLASRLSQTLEKELKLNVTRQVYWTDSEVVLKYLCNETKRFKPFVANRIAEILDVTSKEDWHHVSSENNPADRCSRGMKASALVSDQLWYKGPTFLHNSEGDWPSLIQPMEIEEDDPELKKTCLTIHNTIVKINPSSTDYDYSSVVDPSTYSSLHQLCTKTAWIQRAVRNFTSAIPRFKQKASRQSSLTAEEYADSLLYWVRKAQYTFFPTEIARLKANQPIDKSSKLLALTPFYDHSIDCLRVGGRISHASVPDDAKFQLILPAEHAITSLIAAEVHCRLHHGGQEHMIAELRQKYWPLRARCVVKRTIRSCLICKRQRILPKVPIMADLPQCRLNVSNGPFACCGVDYWGPMLVKERRCTVKRWGCLFTCLSTRAVHLELADSLETDDFILCLRNFIGRRGQPTDMYSDNGTNFVGAEIELSQCLKDLQQDKIKHVLYPLGINWHFNPPAAPHFGGAWERLVQSVKKALKIVLKSTLVRDSVLRTALIEVEAVINSRPLTHNSPDPSDYTALTPNHFLIGRANYTFPPADCDDKEINSRRRWRQCQVVADRVCQRWIREYLPKLTMRKQWKTESGSVSVGDLVLIMEDNVPRGYWELGRITAVYPGKDERIRAVDVKTPKHELRRPVAKICILEENSKS